MDKCEVEFLLQTALHPYTFSNLNFDSKKEEVSLIYEGIKYLISFTQEKGRIAGAVVHYLDDNSNCYHSDLADLIQVCILRQIRIDFLESKLYSEKGEKNGRFF